MTESVAERLTLCEMFQRTVARRGDALALSALGRPSVSWRTYGEQVETLACALMSIGIGSGDTVALLTANSIDFHIADTAVMHTGAVPFSLPVQDPPHTLVDRLLVAAVETLIVEPPYLDLARALRQVSDQLRHVIVIGHEDRQLDPVAGELRITELGQPDRPAGPDFARRWKSVTPEQTATLIFTSGTTGRPKAVQLPHRAITVSLQTFLRFTPGGEGGHLLSYLPLTHIAERFMSHYLSIGYGAEITCIADAGDLYTEIARVRPTRFFGVPRVYAKLADRAREILGAVPDADVAAGLGLDRTRYRGVATAPSSYDLMAFFASIDLAVSDIWGMSEAIMCTTNPTGAIKLGTVGRFLDEVQARVADDGELLIRGPNTFTGYVGQPDETRQMLDDDGWLRTGDLGVIDDEGYLTLIGRRKEIIITATGKNVVPAVIENAVSEASPLIDQVVVVGEGRRYITALIALDGAEVAAFGRRSGVFGSFADLVGSPLVQAEVRSAVLVANNRLQRAETVRSWRIMATQWLPGGDEVTSTMKLRRTEIHRKYAAEIDGLYPTEPGPGD